jgi:membrane protease subunit HflC
MNRIIRILLAVLAVVVIIGSQSVFYVHERQRAIVLQLGQAREDTPRMPGLNFKLPFIQNVLFFEDRLLVFDIAKTETLTADLKVFEIDNYVCWQIIDPMLFFRSLRTERAAERRLEEIVFSQLRAAIGSKELLQVVYSHRAAIMASVLESSQNQAYKYGVNIVDIRIKRADLPNRPAIYARMIAERQRMANMYRYEGESEFLRIRSEAERDRDIILAEANRESIILRGNADAAAIRIFAEALTVDPAFYDFSKSLEVYRRAFRENSRIVFSGEDPLFKYLK